MKKIIQPVIFFVIIVGLFIIYYLILKKNFPSLQEMGQFGDMYGTLNAFFSGLAFLGIIYTIFLQREELSLQRKELQLTREELKRTAEAQETSAQALSRQASSLKISAKLNGKSAILQHYNTLIEISKSELNPVQYKERKEKADQLIEEINILIDDK